jgi:AcrR family transcriptional regulator
MESRARIRSSVLELVRTKPLADLTVNDALDASGVSRQGYYRHYASLDAAVADAVHYDLMTVLDQTPAPSRLSARVPPRVAALTEFLASHAEALHNMRGTSAESLTTALMRNALGVHCEQFAAAVLETRAAPAPPDDQPLLARMLLGGVIETIWSGDTVDVSTDTSPSERAQHWWDATLRVLTVS